MVGSSAVKRAARSIMVVDDDRLVLEHLDMTLKDAGYNTAAVDAGEAALDLVASVHPDLIILDFAMPGMGGPEVLKHLKANKATAAIPVMMLTAKTGRESVEEAVKLGADDYLAKPIDPAKLLTRVEKLLDKADKKKAASGRMELREPDQSFDLPLRRGATRVHLNPPTSSRK